jgi:hypothetical protein
LRAVGIKNPDFELLASKAVKGKTLGKFVPLTKDDVKHILMFAE